MDAKVFFTALTLLEKYWAKVKPWVTPVALAPKSRIPTDTFRIVLNTDAQNYWHMGKRKNEPLTQVNAQYFVTRITDHAMRILACKLKPDGQEETFDLTHDVKSMSGGTPTVVVHVHGLIHPAITKDGETLRARVIFIDQYGNENLGPLTTFRQV